MGKKKGKEVVRAGEGRSGGGNSLIGHLETVRAEVSF